MRSYLYLLIAIAAFTLSPTSMAADVYINGGTHTFNDATYENDWIHLGEGGFAGFGYDGRIGWLSLYNSSMLHMTRGEVVHQLMAADDSFIDFYGGTVGGSLLAQNYAKVVLAGGTVGGNLEVRQNGFIELYGTNFEVTDLSGVTTALSPGGKLSDFGTLVSESGQTPYSMGTIKGTLAYGTPLNNTFKIEVSNDSHPLFGDIHIRKFRAYGAMLVALSQEQETGLLLKQNPTLTVITQDNSIVAKTIVVNSPAEDALLVQGNAAISADGLDIVGNMTVKGSLSYPEEMYIHTENDYNVWPDLEIEEPDYAGLPDSCLVDPNTGKAVPVVIAEGEWVLEPGYYSAGIIVKGGIVTLKSGIYHLGSEAKANSGLVVKGDAVVDANEVMFHIVGTGQVSVGKNAMLKATAPTSGDYAYVLFFQSRNNTSQAVIKGAADCVGVMYFPANHVEITGNVLCLRLYAKTIELSGNAELTVNRNYLPSE